MCTWSMFECQYHTLSHLVVTREYLTSPDKWEKTHTLRHMRWVFFLVQGTTWTCQKQVFPELWHKSAQAHYRLNHTYNICSHKQAQHTQQSGEFTWHPCNITWVSHMQLMMSRLPDQETMVEPPFTGNSSGGATWLVSTNAPATTGDLP